MQSALEGIRVIELASEMGALCGKLMADMGADVILVEPRTGHVSRGFAPFADDEPGIERSLYWWHYHTSKRGVTLDLDDGADAALFERLVASADVVLECEEPGRLAELGIDHDTLRAARPELIHCAITGHGRNSPNRHEAFSDLTLLAKGGPVWSCGYDDHSLPPVRGQGNQGYQTASHYAFMSILAALMHREAGGSGQFIDVSALAAANVTTEMSSYVWHVAKESVQRQTGRHAMPMATMETQFRCADGRYVTTGFPPTKPDQLKTLYDWVVELDGLLDFPEAVFLEQGSRLEQPIDLALLGVDEEITTIFGAAREGLAWVASKTAANDWFERTQAAGMQTGVVYSPDEAYEDEHIVARGFPVEVEHPELGRNVRYPGAPYKFEKTPWRISRRAPHLGEHNDEVLGALDAARDVPGG